MHQNVHFNKEISKVLFPFPKPQYPTCLGVYGIHPNDLLALVNIKF